MVRWLCYPTELGSEPDEIELIEISPDEDEPGFDMYLFRFRMRPPHWAAERGWMVGAAGPYVRGGELFASTGKNWRSTFSNFEAFSGEGADPLE